MKLSELIINACRFIMVHQLETGAIPSGHNGPYQDPETPVRNTAHFLFLLADLFQKTGDVRYQRASERAIDYLFSPTVRPEKRTFHFRNKAGKDHCNGLVGQAWVIEALVKASNVFDRKDCYDLAEEVFLLHPWNKNTALWQRVEIDGRVLSYDGTFNHQLWFAAAGSMLKTTPAAKERSLAFLQKVAFCVEQYLNNVIFHSSPMGSLKNYLGNGAVGLVGEIKDRLGNLKRKKLLYSKSAGYHGFNLYAYAMLKKVFPDKKIWKSEKIKSLFMCLDSPKFQKDLKESQYGYHYNISGIEIAYAVETFFQDQEKAKVWIERQFKETWLDQNRPLAKGVADENTANARIYQATRFDNDYELKIS